MLTQALAPIFDDDTPLPVAQTASQSAVKPEVQAPQTVAPVRPPKPVTPVQTKSRQLPPLGMSVRFGDKKKAVEGQDTEAAAEQVVSYGNTPLDFALLQTVWNDFAQDQETFLQQTLSQANPTIKENAVIHIALVNNFQRDKINEVKAKLLPFLRSHLKNDAISLEVEVSAELESTKAFTPKEKLELMMKDNPALVRLINTLGLEMD